MGETLTGLALLIFCYTKCMLKMIQKYVEPQEILALPFLVLLIFLYFIFDLTIDLRPAFVLWMLVIIGLYAGLIGLALAWRAIKGTAKFSINGVTRKSFVLTWPYVRSAASITIILIIYENLQYLIAYIGSIDQDAALYFYDSMLFGSTHITVALQSFISPGFTLLMNLAYLSLFFYLPVLACVFHFKGELKGWRVVITALTLTLLLGYIGYIFFPAVGPAYYLQHSYQIDLQANGISSFAHDFVHDLSLARGTFPSLHTAISLVFLFLSWKYSRRLFYIFLVPILCLLFSTLYLRYHYLIDLFAGLFLAIIAVYVAEFLVKAWYESDEKISG